MKKNWILWILSLWLIPFPLLAEDAECKPGENLLDCYERTYDEAVERAARNETAAVIAKKPNPSETPDTAATSKDFLRRVIGALNIGELSEGEGSETLTFDLSPRNSMTPVLLKVTRREPAVFGSLVEEIPEDIREEQQASLEKLLEDYDDVEASLSLNLESGQRLGRNIRRYGDLSSPVFEKFATLLKSPETQRLLDVLDQHTNVELTDTAASAGAAVESAVVAAALELVDSQRDFESTLKDRGYFDLANLVANQPQLHFEASYRFREDVVGTDTFMVKGTYEHGLGANVNRLRRYCGTNAKGSDWKKRWKKRLRDVPKTARSAERQEIWKGYLEEQVQHEANPDLTCYETFLRDKDKSMKNAQRISASLEYSHAFAYAPPLGDFGLPQDFMFELDPTDQFKAAFAWGRPLTFDKAGAESSRLDVEGTYEFSNGDDLRNDRGVVTATYTFDLASFSLVWASEPEYLGEVDEKLSARVGLKFKLNKKNDS